MAEHHGAPEVGKLNRSGTEVVEREQIAKERATQRVRSWTVHNEMRGVRKLCRKDSRFCQSYRDRSLALPVWPAHQPRRRLEETSVRGSIVA